jgi:putative membrane protein
MQQKYRQTMRGVASFAFLLGTNAQLSAQVSNGGRSQASLGENVVSTIIFGLLGIVLAVAGFKVFDLVVKQDIQKEVFEKGNLAAAILGSAVVLGICIVIAATLIS